MGIKVTKIIFPITPSTRYNQSLVLRESVKKELNLLEKNNFAQEKWMRMIIIPAMSKQELQVALQELLLYCKNNVDLTQLMLESINTYIASKQTASIYSVFIVATQEQFIKELGLILKNLDVLFAEQRTFKTPSGSYLTAKPLGQNAKIAFVYPGMGSAYPDVMRELLNYFPSLWKDFNNVTCLQPNRFKI